MMNLSEDKALIEAIVLSERILLAVENTDTDKIKALEFDRSKLINEYFQLTQAVNAELTLKLKKLNDQIIEKMLRLKLQTQANHNNLRKSGKASRAYQNVALK